MSKILKLLLPIFVLTLNFFVANSQDVEGVFSDFRNLGNAKPVKVTGGFNAQTGFYGTTDSVNRKPPFAYSLNANVNFSIYGKISIPFSVNYTDKGSSYEAANPWEMGKTFVQGLLSKTGISPK